MHDLGFSEEQAKSIEHRYHELYVVSDNYIQERLKEASEVGYVTVAFGMRVRTPKLSKIVWGSSRVPKEAAAEGRTAGNALGQSYGLLNTRAGIDFQEVTLASSYRLDIWPIAHIHDAQYFIVKDEPNVVSFVNRNLVKAVKWQELPELQHDTVKLGGKLGIFYPDWSNEIEIPNDLTEVQQLREFVIKKYKEYLNPQ